MKSLCHKMLQTWNSVVRLVLTFLAVQLSSAHADLQFAEDSVHVGRVHSGKPLLYHFTFVNQGSAAVEITEAVPSCGCLRPRLEQRKYQPGEQGKLPLEVNTLSQPPGAHTWSIQLRYRRGDAEQRMTLRLSAEVVTEVMVQPAAMIIFADQGIAHDILLTDFRSKPLTISDFQTTSPALKPPLRALERDAEGHLVRRIRVTVSEDCPGGRHEDVLSILTDDPDYRDLKVPITIVKRSRQRVTATPQEVTLTAAPGQPLPSRIVLLRDRDDQPVIVERITADDPAVVCKSAQGPNNMTTLRIQVNRSAIQGTGLDSVIRVEIKQPAQETLTIPVKCLLE